MDDYLLGEDLTSICSTVVPSSKLNLVEKILLLKRLERDETGGPATWAISSSTLADRSRAEELLLFRTAFALDSLTGSTRPRRHRLLCRAFRSRWYASSTRLGRSLNADKLECRGGAGRGTPASPARTAEKAKAADRGLECRRRRPRRRGRADGGRGGLRAPRCGRRSSDRRRMESMQGLEAERKRAAAALLRRSGPNASASPRATTGICRSTSQNGPDLMPGAIASGSTSPRREARAPSSRLQFAEADRLVHRNDVRAGPPRPSLRGRRARGRAEKKIVRRIDRRLAAHPPTRGGREKPKPLAMPNRCSWVSPSSASTTRIVYVDGERRDKTRPGRVPERRGLLLAHRHHEPDGAQAASYPDSCDRSRSGAMPAPAVSEVTDQRSAGQIAGYGTATHDLRLLLPEAGSSTRIYPVAAQSGGPPSRRGRSHLSMKVLQRTERDRRRPPGSRSRSAPTSMRSSTILDRPPT